MRQTSSSSALTDVSKAYGVTIRRFASSLPSCLPCPLFLVRKLRRSQETELRGWECLKFLHNHVNLWKLKWWNILWYGTLHLEQGMIFFRTYWESNGQGNYTSIPIKESMKKRKRWREDQKNERWFWPWREFICMWCTVEMRWVPERGIVITHI